MPSDEIPYSLGRPRGITKGVYKRFEQDLSKVCSKIVNLISTALSDSRSDRDLRVRYQNLNQNIMGGGSLIPISLVHTLCYKLHQRGALTLTRVSRIQCYSSGEEHRLLGPCVFKINHLKVRT